MSILLGILLGKINAVAFQKSHVTGHVLFLIIAYRPEVSKLAGSLGLMGVLSLKTDRPAFGVPGKEGDLRLPVIAAVFARVDE